MSKKSRQDYRYACGTWFMIPRDFLRAFKWDEAILLAYLANIEYITRSRERQQGWFYAKMKRIMSELDCTQQQQSLLIKRLAQKGVISTKREGVPCKRFMRINWTRVNSIIDALPDLIPTEAID
jgi:hypothetical protein